MNKSDFAGLVSILRPSRCGLVLLIAVLCACESTRAPIRDQGRAVQGQTPDIVSASGPVSFQPPPSAAVPGASRTHRVRDGDTLIAVAFMYGLDYRELAAANNLVPPYTIYVDQQLVLIPSDTAAPPVAPAPGSGAWQWPLADRVAVDFRPEINNRLDIQGRAGDSVRAVRDGEVVYSRPFGDDSGNLLIIRHDDRYLSAYTQVGDVLVNTGDRVAGGQAIAELGSVESGQPMIYFNVQRDGAFVDPTNLLP